MLSVALSSPQFSSYEISNRTREVRSKKSYFRAFSGLLGAAWMKRRSPFKNFKEYFKYSSRGQEGRTATHSYSHSLIVVGVVGEFDSASLDERGLMHSQLSHKSY